MRNIFATNSKTFKKLSSFDCHLSTTLGFSLIELLVTFVMIAIISGIGFASFVSYSRRQTVNQAALNIKEVVDLARFNALSSVKPTVCAPADELSAYKVNFCLNAPCPPSVDYEMVVSCGAESVVRTGKLPQNVAVANVIIGSNNCSTITFNILSGNTEGVPCAIYVEGYGNQFQLSIDSVGNVSL